MKLFVIGLSGAGKTPYAKAVAVAYGCPYIQASDWVRERVFVDPETPKREQSEKLTDATRKILAEDPDACVRYMQTRIPPGPCVIDGLRNPADFTRLFNPLKDRVVLIENSSREWRGNPEFDRGVGVIKSIMDWFSDNGVCQPAIPVIHTGVMGALEAVVDEHRKLKLFTEMHCPRVRVTIPPFKARLRRNTIVGGFGGEEVEVIAVESYPGSLPTFTILIRGAVYFYVPASAFDSRGSHYGIGDLPREDLEPFNCPSDRVTFTRFEHLAKLPMTVRLSGDTPEKPWDTSATYIGTVDWSDGDIAAHLVQVTPRNNAPLFVLNHKCVFGTREFPQGLARNTQTFTKEET